MPFLTAIILAAFVGYAGSWYFGFLEGNFSLLLFAATVVTGIYWLAERFVFLPRRRAAAARFETEALARRDTLAKQGLVADNVDIHDTRSRLIMQPWWLDWTAGLFPVIAAVFLLRSFLFEPFKIPSASMVPTLAVGDLILVNKFTYGVRLPVINKKLTDGTPLARGDVVVFRYPPKPSLDYIKRVVGIPGDEVSYLNKQLSINGQPVSRTAVQPFFEEDSMLYATQFEEKFGERTHRVLNNDKAPSFVQGADVFPYRDNCRYSVEGVVCKVPEGHYFMMGDNRDNSLDSRYWGFVPDQNIVGKAFFVWMNFGDLGRIGSFN